MYIVCTEVPPDVIGGLGRYAERMLAALSGLGTPVDVFGPTGRRRAAGTSRTGDVALHRVSTIGGPPGPGTRTPRPVQILARIAGLVGFNLIVTGRILRADAGRSGSVVAVHDWMGCLAGILCRVLGRRPVVFHVHTRELPADPTRRGPVAAGIAALETIQARLAQLIVVPSDRMRAELTARGWPPERLLVIPHGYEDAALLRLSSLAGPARDRVRAAVRRRYLPGGCGALIIYAGRLATHKGVRTLIRAAPLLRHASGPVRIVLIGAQAPRTDDNAEVARLIAEVGAGEQVVAGFRFLAPAEVFAHFLAADVCAFPSTYEPFGLVAVEAMALARPVVVGPGYCPEVVGDGAIRYLHDSPEELAAALRRCLDDPAAARRLADRGAALVRDRYRWDRTARRTLACYAEVAR